MATRTMDGRSGCSGLGLCLLLAACSEPEPVTEPRPPDAVPGRLVGAATVVDAGTLIVDGRTVKLWGVDAPSRDAHCGGGAHAAWPCGEHAAAALAGWLGGRLVNCDPRPRGGDPTLAVCRLNGRDVGKWMVMHGWARDRPAQSRGLYRTLERAAAGRQRGLHAPTPPAPGQAPRPGR